MDTPAAEEPLLSEARAAFLEAGVSVNVASRGADLTPLLGRASGCRASPDRRQVTVYLSAHKFPALVEALAATGAIAVVISQPSTHLTLQLKGRDARMLPLAAADGRHLAAFRRAFIADLTAIGYAADFADAVVPPDDESLVAVRFTPTAAFDQTPGQNAGNPLDKPA